MSAELNTHRGLRVAGLCAVLAALSTGVGFLLVPSPTQPAAAAADHAGSSAATPPAISSSLSLEEFRAFVEKRHGLVLDARPDLHYRRGHVPGALSLPATRFQAGYARVKAKLDPDKTQPIAVYCGGANCDEGEEVQLRLHALGFTRVALFREGWFAWIEAKLPEEKAEGVDVLLDPWKRRRAERADVATIEEGRPS